jgi:hypothetical protein
MLDLRRCGGRPMLEEPEAGGTSDARRACCALSLSKGRTTSGGRSTWTA